MIFLKRYLLCVAALWSLALMAQKPIQLGGSWEVATDNSKKYLDYAMLPGEVKQSGDTLWLRRGVYVPQDWQRQRIVLSLERVYGVAMVLVNGVQVGSDSLACAPHEYDVTEQIVPGSRNTLEVRMTKTECNGIFGKMELRSTPRMLFLRQLNILPQPFDGKVYLDLNVGGDGLRYDDYVVEVIAERTDVDSAAIIRRYYNMTRRHSTFDMFLGNEVALWDEFHPHLYQMAINFGEEYRELKMGMRELTTDSTQTVLINRRPLYLRSVLMGNPRLDSGSGLSDEQAWLDFLNKYKQWGFNHISFEGYCPTEAAFSMADMVGMLLQPGGIRDEKQLQRMMQAYGHHPSLMITEMTGIERIAAMKDFSIEYYKERIERNLQSADLKGFQLEGFAWPEKGEPAKEWLEYCAPIVALATMPKEPIAITDTLVIPLEVCSAFYGELQGVRATYFICDDSLQVVKGGQLAFGNLPMGKNIPLGSATIPLSELPAPGKYSLYVAITGKFRNHWDFQVLPKEEE
jgi:hypothetical protein